ncbi:MAG TPA: S8 family serine peptidase [Tepidisphaeraceae bacterium]|nr:S8 family serine peptidase [Tepidisphaeraceae bacterium]
MNRARVPKAEHAPALAAAARGLAVKFDRYLGTDETFLVKAPQSAAHAQLVAALKDLPGFVAVEPNAVGEWHATPNDPEFSHQWGLNNTGQTYGTDPDTGLPAVASNSVDINAPAAWDFSVGSSSVVMAILDSGMNRNHEDLAANAWSSPIPGAPYPNGYDFANGDADPSDNFGHGTRMAGSAGAVGHNALGGAGVSWNSRIMPLKIGNATPSWAAIIDALNFIVSEWDAGVNIKVANMSLGISAYNSTVDAQIDQLRARDIIVTASAGNSGTNNDVTPVYPASFSDTNIISVAAINDDGGILNTSTTDSNFGSSSVDIAAPGHNHVTSTWISGSATPNNDYAFSTGTSPAAAIVAGAVATLFAIDPEAPWATVRDAVVSTAHPLASLTGKVDSDGMLDLAAAVTYMRQVNGGSDPNKWADRTVLGDALGAANNDDIIVRQSGTNAVVLRWQGGVWQQVTSVANSNTKRINIFSLRGNDTVTIENGVLAKVFVYGGGGGDNLRGKVGSSSASAGVVLYGGINNDTIVGSDFSDYLSGQGGDDVLTGNSGADSVFGDANNDILNLIDSVADGYNGGSGTNTINKDGIDFLV